MPVAVTPYSPAAGGSVAQAAQSQALANQMSAVYSANQVPGVNYFSTPIYNAQGQIVGQNVQVASS